MKSVAAFFMACLLLGRLAPQSGPSELVRLPRLLEHCRFHRSAAGGGLPLAGFVAGHHGAGTEEHFGCTFSARHRHDHAGLPLHGRHASGSGAFAPVAARPAAGPREAPGGDRAAWQPAAASLYRGHPGTALLQPPRA